MRHHKLQPKRDINLVKVIAKNQVSGKNVFL